MSFLISLQAFAPVDFKEGFGVHQEYDIGLFGLHKPQKFSKYIQPLCFNSTLEPEMGETCLAGRLGIIQQSKVCFRMSTSIDSITLLLCSLLHKVSVIKRLTT